MYGIARHLCIHIPPVLVYHNGLLLTFAGESPCKLVWTIAHVEWPVFFLVEFLYASPYSVPIDSKSVDSRVYDDSDVPGTPLWGLFPLPIELVQFLRGLGIQNLVRGTEHLPKLQQMFHNNSSTYRNRAQIIK